MDAPVPETPPDGAVERARELHAMQLGRSLILAALAAEWKLTADVALRAYERAREAFLADFAALNAASRDEKRGRARETFVSILVEARGKGDRKAALKAGELLARLDGVLDATPNESRSLGDLAVLLKIGTAPKDPTE